MNLLAHDPDVQAWLNDNEKKAVNGMFMFADLVEYWFYKICDCLRKKFITQKSCEDEHSDVENTHT